MPRTLTPRLRDRAQGAYLGLALGDAYGRSLEFVRGPAVRTRPVDLSVGGFKWTDDTHMALYLGKAILDLPASPLNAERFGHAVGRRFVEWLHDPLQPTTAPGQACMAGARAYQQTGSWRDSGAPDSDGCGAVMRVCPVGLAWADDDLLEGARVSAVVTHGHPNATEASVAAAWLVREAVDGARFDAELVRQAIAGLRGPWSQGGVVAQSLQAALAIAPTLREAPAPVWLPEELIPPGDGGWRSGSALGLAVTAALAWPDDFALAIDKAARIDGDSDSVAALAGMFLGAAHGTDLLPIRWLAVLPGREDITHQADQLIERWATGPVGPTQAGGPQDASVRTSTTHPIEVSWLNLPTPGRVGLTLAPGQHAAPGLGAPWERDLDQDLDRLLSVHQASLLVSLLEDEELAHMGITDLNHQAEARGLVTLRLPTPAGGVPTVPGARFMVETVLAFARAGHNAVILCSGGQGRTDTLAACCLVAQGQAPTTAIARVRRWRGHAAIANADQERFVHAFARTRRG